MQDFEKKNKKKTWTSKALQLKINYFFQKRHLDVFMLFL